MKITWRKSSYSGGANDELCVELGAIDSGIGVRDSKDPAAGHLVLSSSQFADLLDHVRRGARRA
ncbi:DUF397 domain-containing protein [Actinomadura parmotrematis]|uniref:DUF397 domain-containing protein n=1 Tax=Actinomadura parmotrematis TaxID=2864039 RepID=A0ABS7FYL8_9ACTN|nr:DUF397 domain-containing protein [Actinomadura parmotrematis]MBW8485539.1 DUF397 domain-containing protein [Actinomadura parmotrematis]